MAWHTPVLRSSASKSPFKLRPQRAERTERQTSPAPSPLCDNAERPVGILVNGVPKGAVGGCPEDAASELSYSAVNCPAEVKLADSPARAFQKASKKPAPVLQNSLVGVSDGAFNALLKHLSFPSSAAGAGQSKGESATQVSQVNFNDNVEVSSESGLSTASDDAESPKSRQSGQKRASLLEIAVAAVESGEKPNALKEQVAELEVQMAAARAATKEAREHLRQVRWLEEVQSESLTAQNAQVIELRTRLHQLHTAFDNRQFVLDKRIEDLQNSACKAVAQPVTDDDAGNLEQGYLHDAVQQLQQAIRDALDGEADAVLGAAASLTDMAAALEQAAAGQRARAPPEKIPPSQNELATPVHRERETSPLPSAGGTICSSRRSTTRSSSPSTRRPSGSALKVPGAMTTPKASRVLQLPTPPPVFDIHHTTYLDDFAIRQESVGSEVTQPITDTLLSSNADISRSDLTSAESASSAQAPAHNRQPAAGPPAASPPPAIQQQVPLRKSAPASSTASVAMDPSSRNSSNAPLQSLGASSSYSVPNAPRLLQEAVARSAHEGAASLPASLTADPAPPVAAARAFTSPAPGHLQVAYPQVKASPMLGSSLSPPPGELQSPQKGPARSSRTSFIMRT